MRNINCSRYPDTGPGPRGPASWTARSCGCQSTRRWWRTGGRRWGSCGAKTGARALTLPSSPPAASWTRGTSTASVLRCLKDLQVWVLRGCYDDHHIVSVQESSSLWPLSTSLKVPGTWVEAPWHMETFMTERRRLMRAGTRSHQSQMWRSLPKCWDVV